MAASGTRPARVDPWGVYRLQVALGSAGLAGAAVVLAVAVSAVDVAPAAAHHLAFAGLDFTYPALNAAAAFLLAFAALGAAVLVVTVRGAWRQVRGHRRLVRALSVAGTLPEDRSVTVIHGDEPLAFCAGWLRPSVYVSTAVLERLSEAELQAVLAHERHHRAVRDPLRLAVGRVLREALFFLPVLRSLHDRYGEVAEQRADAAAVSAVGGATAPLASAMLAFGSGQPGDVVRISPDRVDSLLGHPRPWRLPWTLLVAAPVTLAVALALIWRAAASASLHTSLNLPIVSSQPCVLVLALVPIVACLAAVFSRG